MTVFFTAAEMYSAYAQIIIPVYIWVHYCIQKLYIVFFTFQILSHHGKLSTALCKWRTIIPINEGELIGEQLACWGE